MNKITKDLYSIHLKEGKIEKINKNYIDPKSEPETIMLVDKINELTDAVNELQKERLGK